MKKILPLLLVAFLISCSEDDPQTVCDPGDRIGARCKDGTSSTATGSGACSGHGGVEYWLCK